MLSLRLSSSHRSGLLATAIASALLLLSGCGIGSSLTGPDSGADLGGSRTMGGILHGGPNPIVGATVTLYTTTSNSTGVYGAAATAQVSTSTGGDGSFAFTLPSGSAVCPSGEYAYVTAVGGKSGALTANSAIVLMTPIGLCDTYYSYNSTTTLNTYKGSSLWLDEMTTAVSAYALGNFTTMSGTTVNIGAPTNNHGTASAATPSAAGLGHAFSNALAIINNNTGQPNAFYTPYGKSATTGIVPDAELYLLGNILQACVNSTGPTTTSTATSNDGTGCGVLFSMTTPPQSSAASPTNTMQAMLNLARYPSPSVNTWADSTCKNAGSGTVTATSCLFNLSPATGAAYPGALTTQPPDWALAIVYPTGSGANTTATACTTAGTCPGLAYPFYVTLDLNDNVYVLNYDAYVSTGNFGAKTWTNIVGFGFDGTPLMATPKNTTDLLVKQIATDTAQHVFGANNDVTTGHPDVLVYVTGTSAGAVTTVTNTQNDALALRADVSNNIYTASTNTGVNIRKLTYGGTSTAPTYTVSSLTTTAPAAAVYDMGFDSREDMYFLTSAPSVYILPNTATVATSGAQTAPTYAAGGIVSTTISGSITNSFGIAASPLAYSATSGVSAYAFTVNGVYPISKTGTGSSTALTAGTVIATPYLATSGTSIGRFNRYLQVDGLGNIVSADGDNGSISGVTFYDTTDSLYLGTYEGCYVASGSVCGTTTTTGVAMSSARDAAIDSAGDIWVVSGASSNLTELIGAAAPTWPGLSMAKFGEPQ